MKGWESLRRIKQGGGRRRSECARALQGKREIKCDRVTRNVFEELIACKSGPGRPGG